MKIARNEIFDYEIIMDDGSILSFEDYMTREYECGKKAGFQDGSNTVIAKILEEASSLFASGKKDEEAISLRSLAKRIEKSLNL